MNSYKNFWESDKAQDFHEMKNYKTMEIPKIAGLIEKANPATFLDYGCGNGLINTMLSKKIEKTLFDINLNNISIKNPDEYNCKISKRAADLPSDYFDMVLLSFVLVCVPDEKQIMEILRNIRRVKKRNGALIILESHPCFVQYSFSYFDSALDKDFKYLSDGAPFQRNIFDSAGDKISFIDYHWPLSFKINKLIETGFNIVHMEETPDEDFCGRPRNKFFPPLYYFICR